jgi:hypothetical protein
MDLIKTLTTLEPLFKQAADLAWKMQKGIETKRKFGTGFDAVDLVTEADLQVQELLLKEMAKTELVNCRLMAEEDTPSVSLFNGSSKYFLIIDPIDGTAIYSRGGKHFSVIVSLHDGKNLLYTFMHFPALNWTHRIVGSKYSMSGETPSFNIPSQAQKYILYYSGHPETTIPELYQKLVQQGLSFINAYTITEDYGITEMLFCNKIAGRYQEDINVYDGLTSLHYAQVIGLKIYSGGPNGTLDLTNIKNRETGLYYPGFYLILK